MLYIYFLVLLVINLDATSWSLLAGEVFPLPQRSFLFDLWCLRTNTVMKPNILSVPLYNRLFRNIFSNVLFFSNVLQH